MKHANLPVPISNPPSPAIDGSRKCFGCDLFHVRHGEVWKCSVVISEDTEEEEEEAEMASALAMRMA